MKVGDLVRVVWTGDYEPTPAIDSIEADDHSPVTGIVTKMRKPKGRWVGDRQRVEIFSNGCLSWFEHGDLEVVNESR